MPVFDRSIVAMGRIFVAGEAVPDDVAAKITNPALLAQIDGTGPVPSPSGLELGDEGARTVEQVVAWVGGDPERAARALQWEHDTRGGDPRVSLLHALNDVVAGG